MIDYNLYVQAVAANKASISNDGNSQYTVTVNGTDNLGNPSVITQTDYLTTSQQQLAEIQQQISALQTQAANIQTYITACEAL